jgi:hypothetical protein
VRQLKDNMHLPTNGVDLFGTLESRRTGTRTALLLGFDTLQLYLISKLRRRPSSGSDHAFDYSYWPIENQKDHCERRMTATSYRERAARPKSTDISMLSAAHAAARTGEARG